MNFRGQKIILAENIKKILDENTIFIIEKIGLPKKIIYNEYLYLSEPYLKDKVYLVLGKIPNTNTEHYLIINIETKEVFHEWNYDNIQNLVFLNSSIEKSLMCRFTYDFFIRRLILSESLGGYYDNCNYEKYASLLKEMIFDIDKEATEKGAWASLISEMSMGAI
ncbi:hypothetical protein [Flavobacterium piscis]|uniref:Immunity protein 63 domain-containing protein n=1 Tax=Flavobacterium piscis TaxID=1114874 RepID=A0ABU1YE84_9FLAO|nr:hypothetical protein [Flavobacterium piscis]MDR7211945.1 hypothetical protein [Flavobacterium piscis]